MKSSSNKRSSLKRRFLLGAGLVTMVGGLAVTAASCGAVLPDITDGQCGNYVVEPNNGEACDDEVTGKCGAPGSYAPCKYICNEPSDCEPGYGCGLDGICRQSGGLAELPFSIGATGARQLLRGDFDGDGRDEIVTADGNVATIHFLTTEGFISSSKAFPYTGVTPAIGDLSGDGLSDLVLALGHTMSIWLGQEDRTLVPLSLPLLYSTKATNRIVPLGYYTGDGYVLALPDGGPNSGPASFIQFMPDGGYARKAIANNSVPAGKLQGAIATRGIEEGNQPCGLVTGEIDATISLITTVKRCKGTENVEVVWTSPLGLGNKPWAGVYAHDLDNDGVDELLYGINNIDGQFQRLMVDKVDATGKPLGMAIPFLEQEPGKCLPGILSSAPLAVADLNGDGQVDFVDNRGLLLSNSKDNPKPYKRVCHSYTAIDLMNPQPIDISWTSAVIGDINGDKWPDVLGARKNLNIIDLWTWKPEGLTTIPISIAGPAQDLVAGDLDGDTITDIAFRIVPPIEDALAPTPIFAMFGNPSALPSSPQSVGEIRGVRQLVMSRLQGANQLGESDLFDDLLILADEWKAPGQPPTGESPLTLIQGSSSRSLVAPLILQTSTRPEIASKPQEYPPITGLAITDFGLPFDYQNELGLEPSTILVSALKQIWTAGFRQDGSSVQIKNDLAVGNGAVLFAPVDRVEGSEEDSSILESIETRQVAVFADSASGPGIWFLEQTGTDKFTGSPDDFTLLDPAAQLPSSIQPDVPYVFADLDANGRRDVVLIAEKQLPDQTFESTIVIYWNGDERLESRAFSLFDQTTLPFDPTSSALVDGGAGGGGMGMGGMGMGGMGSFGDMPDAKRIQDIAAINYDDDKYLELAILTRGGIYIAKLYVEQVPSSSNPSTMETVRRLRLPKDNFVARVQGGDALLTIDANSDGIDDLVVGDPGKLLLFFGAERQQ